MNETVIRVNNVKKKYKLGAIGGTTLKGEIQSWWARKRGKDDPNSLVGITEYNRDFWALNGISFEVKKGERVGIIGRNGAGKSTLLKILSQVTAPTSGKIEIAGKITSMLEVGTGFHGELTGRENIYLNGAILGMKENEITDKINQIIEFSECGEFIDTPVKRYSSGMFVKLAFSVASHLNSDILIMDEVLAVGDVNFQKKCLDKMAEIAKNEGKTILYVSHNMSTIRRLCNRVIVLDRGKIVYDGGVEGAINLYLQMPSDISLHNDFSAREIIDEQFNKKAKLLSLDILEKDNNVFEVGEKIVFNVKMRCEEQIEKMFLRCIINKMDDTRVGTAFSEPITKVEVGKITECKYEMDISSLAPGRYGMWLILFYNDGFGYEEKYDLVSNALIIDIVNTTGKFYHCEWNEDSWGNTVYSMRLIKEQ